MKKLLWVGDAGCPSGFAKATHNILDALSHKLGGMYDVTVMGINYRGDPDVRNLYPYDIYAAAVEGDAFGILRLIWMCDKVRPDVIVLQNDGWNIPPYIKRLRAKKPNGEFMFPEFAAIPVVAVVAVDGKNFQGKWLQGVALAIFWTEFALNEAREGGYCGEAEVIPLGVDAGVYRQMERADARKRLPKQIQNSFLVGNVNRNQPRKRWDLTVKYFAEWITSRNIRDAYLYLHTAPTGDLGCDVRQLASYYRVIDRLALVAPPPFEGIDEDVMAETYNCFDVQISTTQGEGFGLTTFEGAACHVPQVVPDWASLGELMQGAACLVPCPTTALNQVAPDLNVIGGVPDEKLFVEALDRLYRDPELRSAVGATGAARANEERFRWASVGARYVAALDKLLTPKVKLKEREQVPA